VGLSSDAITADRATMKSHRIPRTDLDVSRIAYGCDFIVRQGVEPDALSASDIAGASQLVNVAYDSGITLFDTASGLSRR
jgi:aryl-alcohol dehydrogenase-like predicted oxidoreductase